VTMTDGVAGDQIKLDGELHRDIYDVRESGVAEIAFADGTSITQAQLAQEATTGSPTNTSLYGTDQAEVFDSRGYAPYEQGNGGQDTFVYNPGYGQLEINENAGFGVLADAVLQVGGNLTSSDFSAAFDSSGNVILTDGVAGDQIKLDGELHLDIYNVLASGVAEITFADGTSITQAQLAAEAATATPNGSGTDLYQINANSVSETINLGSADTVQFNGVASQGLWFDQVGNNLQIEALGSQEKVTVTNWANDQSALVAVDASDGLQVDAQLSSLVSAMATFAADNPGFSVATATTMPQDSSLQLSIAAAWHSKAA
jgi:hypothetical protein